jgi:hypothetical protein
MALFFLKIRDKMASGAGCSLRPSYIEAFLTIFITFTSVLGFKAAHMLHQN